MNEKEYWNMVANEKKFNTPFQMDLFKKYVDLDKKILDYGCGYGRVLKELYDHGYNNLLGVDFSSEMIHRAKELYPYIDFNLIDGDTLNFDDESFDSIVLVAVLNCIHEEEKQVRLMKELYRVLKRDGIIYVNDFLLNQSDMYLERYDEYKEKYKSYGVFETVDGGIFKHLSMPSFFNLLKNYRCEETKTLKYTTMNGHTANGIYYIGKK